MPLMSSPAFTALDVQARMIALLNADPYIQATVLKQDASFNPVVSDDLTPGKVSQAEAFAAGLFPKLKETALAAITSYLGANAAATKAQVTTYANANVDAWITAVVAAVPFPPEFAPYKATIRNTLVTLANTAVDGWIAELLQAGEAAIHAASS